MTAPAARRSAISWTASLAWVEVGGRAVRLLALFVLILTCTPAFVQGQTASTGAVAGTVTDPQSAVVVGAKVELHNTGTNVSREQTRQIHSRV